jgi:hypothetical protein
MIFHFCLTEVGQPGEQLIFTRVAVKGTNHPKRRVVEYIDQERTQGRLLKKVFIVRARAGNAPFPPKFEPSSDLFIYPQENATGKSN